MPISYVLDRAQCQLRTTVTGVVTVEDILGHFHTIRREEALLYGEIIDANGAAQPFLSPSEIWRAARMVMSAPVHETLGPRAVVVTNPTAFGLTRMFVALLSDDFPMRVFREVNQAEQWLAEVFRPAKVA